jgi:hypothetical protein
VGWCVESDAHRLRPTLSTEAPVRPSRQQRHAALEAAQQWQAEERTAAQQRLLAMAETDEPTPPVRSGWVSSKRAVA